MDGPTLRREGAPDNFISDKGKIEKRFDYLQRRLPPMCERYGITEVDQGGRCSKTSSATRTSSGGTRRRARSRPRARGQGRLRVLPGETDLGLLFALYYQRVVHSDGKVRFQGRAWSVSAPAGSWVTACWRPAGRVAILWNEQPVGSYAL